MQPKCTLVAHLRAIPERADEFEQVLMGLVGPSRSEAGCIDYHFHRSEDASNVFMFYENWTERAELDKHLELPMLQEFFEKTKDYLEEDVEINFYEMKSAYDK